jgi:hypothetical protein
MIGGWREDFNEGPYDYLAVRDGWEIFSADSKKYRVTFEGGSGEAKYFSTLEEAKEYCYECGCSRPKETK